MENPHLSKKKLVATNPENPIFPPYTLHQEKDTFSFRSKQPVCQQATSTPTIVTSHADSTEIKTDGNKMIEVDGNLPTTELLNKPD